MRFAISFAGAFLFAGALVPVSAFAATAATLSLAGMIDRSELIVEGEVAHSWVAWDPGHRYIWTHHEVRVIDSLRGSGSAVIVSEPGGSLDGINQAFSGSIGYEPSERVLLFLYRTPIGYCRTTGGGQGKITLMKNGRTRGRPGTASTPGTHVVTSGLLSDGQMPATSLGGLPVAELKSLVRALTRTRSTLEVR